MSNKYRIHRPDLSLTTDLCKVEQFLYSLEGERLVIIPNLTVTPFTWASRLDFLLVTEKAS